MYVDKRLSGIQAVQTLSRLNRAYNGSFGLKDTTYILDFVNDPEEILSSFKVYYETAELAGVTDPELVLTLKSKLDSSGNYDSFEAERVALVELNPKSTQAMLAAAIEPAADRLLKKYKAAKEAKDLAERAKDTKAADIAKDEMDALLLFKRDLSTFVRIYSFLSQLFDYGNTDVEKRAIFFRRLLPLLEFGREREGVDLSKVVLTHHRLKDLGQQDLLLGAETKIDPRLKPLTDSGGGELQDKEKILLAQIVEQVNDLFEGELTEGDQLVYVNNVLKGKLLESDVLVQQAMNNSKEQFANSPDLANGILNAIMDALSAHSTMSKQALDSERVRDGLKDVLLGPAELYEALRSRGLQSTEHGSRL
jgi:type I restriction enzyme R subunit